MKIGPHPALYAETALYLYSTTSRHVRKWMTIDAASLEGVAGVVGVATIQALRRLRAAKAINPLPRPISVAGSGTGWAVTNVYVYESVHSPAP